ncbi:EAL domain-containing protein [Candidatus Auribacterota bacterium]
MTEINKILIIEAEASDIGILKEYLSCITEAEIYYSESLADGIKKLKKEAIDIVLIDLTLPDSEGIETFRKLKSQAGETPIIILSTLALEKLATEAVKEGAYDYLIKEEISKNILSRAISYAAERKRMACELKNAQKLEHQLSYYDKLTGLPNRQSFNEHLHQKIAEAKRHKNNIAILFLGLDGFKLVNNSFGYSAGDILLKTAADRLGECLRDYDTVARLGGDEFVVVLTNISEVYNPASVAERILKAMLKPFYIKGSEAVVTVSIGISFFPSDGEEAEILIKRADIAMYRAKAQGKNRYYFYDTAMEKLVLERVAMENGLRSALAEEQFKILYHPEVDLISEKIKGLEALLRWQHPTLGEMAPAKFFQIAEEIGLGISIFEWVLRQVCRQYKDWKKKGFPVGMMTINISNRQFKSKKMIEIISQVLEEEECDTIHLGLEITESTALDDIKYTMKTLSALRDKGIEFLVDDFGIGNSSLKTLKLFPLNTLKIDAALVAGIPGESENVSIIKAIISLANELKLKVIAEGVETEEQKDCLCKLGCSSMQGFVFSKPLTALELEKQFFQSK